MIDFVHERLSAERDSLERILAFHAAPRPASGHDPASDLDCHECTTPLAMRPSHLLIGVNAQLAIVTTYLSAAHFNKTEAWAFARAVSELSKQWQNHPDFNPAWVGRSYGVTPLPF